MKKYLNCVDVESFKVCCRLIPVNGRGFGPIYMETAVPMTTIAPIAAKNPGDNPCTRGERSPDLLRLL